MGDILGNTAKVKEVTSNVTKDEEEINEVFGCDDNPLSYVIQPQVQVRMVEKNHVTKLEDFEDLF